MKYSILQSQFLQELSKVFDMPIIIQMQNPSNIKQPKQLTIAEQLNITDFPFRIYNKKGKVIYHECIGHWHKREFDKNGNKTYFETDTGFWYKKEFDENGTEIYYEASEDGVIFDRRPKPVTEMTIKELEHKLGINNLKIIKEK